MKNEYYRDIIRVLLDRGSEGATAFYIARQIYNRHYGLFETEVVFRDIHHRVRLFLWHHARRPYSPFMRIGWATYAIKPDFAIQLDFIDELYSLPQEEALPSPTLAAEPDTRGYQLFLFSDDEL